MFDHKGQTLICKVDLNVSLEKHFSRSISFLWLLYKLQQT